MQNASSNTTCMPRNLAEQQDVGCIRQPELSCETDKTRWLIAVVASLALNGAVMGAPTIIEKIQSERVVATAVMAVKMGITKICTQLKDAIFFGSQSDSQLKSKTKQEWRNLLDADQSLPGFDYGNFFLKVPWLEGYLAREEMETDQKKLDEITNHYSSSVETQPPIKVIGSIIAEQSGEYDEESGNLHELLTDKRGNCHARAQNFISLLSKIFPSIPLKIQISRRQTEDGTDRMHEAALAEIDGAWHLLEPGMPKVTMEDL